MNNIIYPTLTISGDDRIVGVNASFELSDKAKGSELFVYKGLGHAVYEEAKDFNNQVLYYLLKWR